MNALASFLARAASELAASSWQVAVLILLVFGASALLAQARPAVRYVLWCVVLVRLCLPWSFHSPLGIAAPARRSLIAPMRSATTASAVPPVQMENAIERASLDARLETRNDPIPLAGDRLRSGTITASNSVSVTSRTWCGLIWLIGALTFSSIVVARWVRLRRIAIQSKPCPRPDLRALLDQWQERLHFRGPIALKLLPPGAETLGPCATGWWRPAILLPARFVEQWDLGALEPILLHELAHIRRGDVVINGLQVVSQIVYWFHPLVWLAHSRLRRERELICDDFAVRHTGGSAQRYGATVIRALEEIGSARSWSFAGVAMAESALADRLRRLLDRAYALPRPLGRWTIGGLVVAGLVGVLVASDPSPNPIVANATGGAPTVVAPVPAADTAQTTDSFLDESAPIPASLLKAIERAHREELNKDDARALPVIASETKGELSGRVVDGEGKPVADALVDAWDWCPGDETHTDADGTFRLTKLDPHTRVEVRFIKPGFAPFTIIKQSLGAMTAPVVLDRETYFEGVVTAPDGTPVPNAFIRANQGPKQADGVHISTIWTETHSDAQGRYQLRVQDDTYDLQVTSASGLVARLPKVTIAPRQAVPLDLRLEPGVIFRARLVDSGTSKGVAGVKLSHWQHPGVEGTTNAQGELEIRGLTPGPFEFDVIAAGYARWWSEESAETQDRRKIGDNGWQRNFDHLHFNLEPGMAPVTIALEKAVRIRGRVIDPDGQPVAGATAAPAHTGTGNSLAGDTRFSVKTAADGTFEMFVPASNDCEYNLVAHDGAYQQWRKWANGISAPFKTQPGQQIKEFEVKLERPATVRGRALDAAGHPLVDREVRTSAADLRDNRYYDPTSRTGSDGRFEIKFIRPGEHHVQVAPFWLHPTKATTGSSTKVAVKAGQILDLPDLTAPDAD